MVKETTNSVDMSFCNNVANCLNKIKDDFNSSNQGSYEGRDYLTVNYFTGQVGTTKTRWMRASLQQMTSVVDRAMKELHDSSSESEKSTVNTILSGYECVVKKIEEREKENYAA